MIKSEPVDRSSLDLVRDLKPSHLYHMAKYNGQLLLEMIEDELEKFRNLEVHDDDVWVVGFPKSGTTWVQEMIWSIKYGFEDTDTHLGVRFPFIDYNFLVPKQRWNDDFITLEWVAQTSRPRFLKTHLQFDLWPSQLQRPDCKAKIIFVTRNPRDSCISYYHQQKNYLGYEGTLEQYADLFIKDLLILGPFWQNVLSIWNRRHQPNILIVRYEDMKKNLSKELIRVSEFLGESLSTERISQLCDHLHFDTMKLNPLVNSHWKPWQAGHERHHDLIRVGKVNQWIEALSEEQKKDFEKWEKKNLENTDYPLEYDDLSVY